MEKVYRLESSNWTRDAVWTLNGGWQTAAAERSVYVNLTKNIHLYLTLNYVTASEHLKYSAQTIYGVFYNVFVGLNNNTIVAMQNIEFGSVSSGRYPDPAENASIEAIPILNIGLAHP